MKVQVEYQDKHKAHFDGELELIGCGSGYGAIEYVF
jgi:hypothetical protein